jgi:hypothetical protein
MSAFTADSVAVAGRGRSLGRGLFFHGFRHFIQRALAS